MVAYAPNRPEPLEVSFEIEGIGRPLPGISFNHGSLSDSHRGIQIQASWAQGAHFWDPMAKWNGNH